MGGASIPHSGVYATSKQAARTADFAVRVFSVAIITTVPYSIAVSELRRPFLSHRYFFIAWRMRPGAFCRNVCDPL